MLQRRVVITGMGMVTSLGQTVNENWQNIIAGKNKISLIDSFDTTEFSVKFASLVQNFNADEYLSSKDKRKMDLFIQYGIVAGLKALEDSGLIANEENSERIGVSIGSAIGGLGTIEENSKKLNTSGPKRVSPFIVPASIINMISGHISILKGFKGPNLSIGTACTTGVHNIGNAARLVAYGDADVILAGGAEKASSPVGMAGFASAKALSTRNDDPETASRPWDKDRDGFVLGDGAGAVVVEAYEHAIARNAPIYAEIVGYGMSADAHHMTSPPESGAGAALAMKNAIRDAGITPKEIGYINAHGTSTLIGDLAETVAIKNIFQDSIKQIQVSSTKSMLGHLLGAAGAVETVITALMLGKQIIPPTINLQQPGSGCDLDYVPHEARTVSNINYALCNSFGFGGTNGTILLKRFVE